MKKILLSTIVGFASYSGAYASNEIVNNNIISQKVEVTELQPGFNKANQLEEVDPVYNCFTKMTIKDKEGATSSVYLKTTTSSSDACKEKGEQYKNLYVMAGFEISEYENNFSS